MSRVRVSSPAPNTTQTSLFELVSTIVPCGTVTVIASDGFETSVLVTAIVKPEGVGVEPSGGSGRAAAGARHHRPRFRPAPHPRLDGASGAPVQVPLRAGVHQDLR